MSTTELRRYAMRKEMMPDVLPFRSWIATVVEARLEFGSDWYMADDTQRRMFLLLVAEDIDTYWQDLPPLAYATRSG